MNNLELAIVVYAVSRTITSEVGPFGIFRKFRRLAGVLFDIELAYIDVIDKEVVVHINEIVDQENYFAILSSCYYCMSFWISLIVCLMNYRSLYIALKNLALVNGLAMLLYGVENGLYSR